MPNPGQSQSACDSFFDRALHSLRKATAVKELLDRFRSSSAVIVRHGDVDDELNNWSLSGVDIGTNTSAAGLLYVRIVANGGNWDVNVYKATGGGSGDKVCSCTNVAAGAVGTLSAANSSGMTGSVTLDAGIAGDTTDDLRLRVLTGFPAMDAHVFDQTSAYDGRMIAAHQDLNRQIVSALQGLEQACLAFFRSTAFLEYASDFLKVGSRTLLSKQAVVDDGAVTLAVTGILEDLRRGMEGNTTEQHVLGITLTGSSVTYDAANTGQGTLTKGTIREALQPGRITVTCTDENMPEKFQVTLQPSDTFLPRVVGANLLEVGKEWIDPSIPISLTLSRTYDKNGTDGTNVQVAAASGASTTGLTADNSDGGVLYGKNVANGSNWNVEFYRDSSRTRLVAKATNIATSAAFTATQQNGSGLTVSWTLGGTPTNGGTFELDANPFELGPPADTMYFDVTATAGGGKIQDAFADYLGWYLNTDASPTIPDTLLERGGKINVEVY